MKGEVGSGLNGHRPQFMKVLADPSLAIMAVEHRDRLMRLCRTRRNFIGTCVVHRREFPGDAKRL